MNIPLYGDEYRKLFGNMATLHPSAQDEPNMTVKISAGGFWSWLEGVASYIEYIGGSSPAITAPLTNAKWVVVTLNTSGMVVIINGDSGVAPVLPVIPANRYPIALVYVQAADLVLTNESIFDARPIFSNPVRSHADLMDTTETGSHSIAAITDLVDTLATLALANDLTNGLADKADVGGTPATTFKLNQDETGTPSSDVYITVERGDATNVSIMWDEGVGWKYTNDGTNWYTLSGAYYNDGTQDLGLKVYSQTSAPTLADGKSAIWIDTDDANKVYLAFKPVGLTQVKVQLT